MYQSLSSVFVFEAVAISPAPLIGELGLPHMLLGLVAGEGWWMACTIFWSTFAQYFCQHFKQYIGQDLNNICTIYWSNGLQANVKLVKLEKARRWPSQYFQDNYWSSGLQANVSEC